MSEEEQTKATQPARKKTTTARKTAAKPKPATRRASAASKTATVKKTAKSTKSTSTDDKVHQHTASEADSAATSASSTASSSATAEDIISGKVSDESSLDWKSILVHAIFMIGYGAVAWFAIMVGFTLVVIQFIVSLILRKPQAELASWIRSIGRYLSQIFNYLSMESDEKPFPLGKPFPLKSV